MVGFAGVGCCRDAGVEQTGQEDLVEAGPVATVAWPGASSQDGVVARARALGRVLSRGGLQDMHTDDLSPA
jgi:hypothetical protein